VAVYLVGYKTSYTLSAAGPCANFITHMTTFIELFPNLITPQESERLARETGWRQRQSPIEPIEFHTSLVLGQASALHMTLNSQANSLHYPSYFPKPSTHA